MKVQSSRHPIPFLLGFLLGFVFGCGPVQAPAAPDAEEISDVGADADATLDAGSDTDDSPDEDTGPDVSGDEECDPEEVIAELYGVHIEPSEGAATFTVQGDGYEMVVDASLGGRLESAMYSYVYIDLDTPALLALSDVEALDNTEWDLAFHRSFVRLNGADSGPGDLMLARLDDTTWETASPPDPDDDIWRADEFLSDDCHLTTFGLGWPDTAFAQWYDYDPVHHTLSPPEGTVYYLYDSGTHHTTKLAIVGYDGGAYTIRWE